MELTTAVFCFGVPAASILGYDASEYERCRWVKFADEERMGCGKSGDVIDGVMMGALGGLYLAGTIHSILFVATSVQCCYLRGQKKDAAAAAAAATGAEEGRKTEAQQPAGVMESAAPPPLPPRPAVPRD